MLNGVVTMPSERGPWQRRWQLFAVWVALVVGVLLWWTSRYTGIVGRMGEWQFGELDRYYPTLTAVAIAALLTIPLAIIMALVQRRRARQTAMVDTAQAQSLTAALRLEWFFWFITAGAVAVALIAFFQMRQLPVGEGTVRVVTVGASGDAAANRYEGPARLDGQVDLTHVAKLRDKVLFEQRDVYIAPVLARGAGAGAAVSYFTVVRPTDLPETRFEPIAGGVLHRDGVPHELLNLFRGAGVNVGKDNALLVPDAQSMGWRYRAALGQSALVAAIGAIFALLARRSRKHLARKFDTPVH